MTEGQPTARSKRETRQGWRPFDADGGGGPHSEEDVEAVFTEPIWSLVAH